QETSRHTSPSLTDYLVSVGLTVWSVKRMDGNRVARTTRVPSGPGPSSRRASCGGGSGDRVALHGPLGAGLPAERRRDVRREGLQDVQVQLDPGLRGDREHQGVGRLHGGVGPQLRDELIGFAGVGASGMMYTEDELKRLGEICLKHNITIVSDEIYETLVYTNDKHVSIAEISKELKDITVVINGVSKSHAMTGWRIGYAAGPEKIIQAMTNHASHATSNPTSISQY